ncbi:hypothetical protein Tco_0383552 [Tanacetum coccineum]
MLATRGSGKVTTKEARDNKTKGHKVPIGHTTWPINKKAYAGSLPLTPTAVRNKQTLTCYECGSLGHYKSNYPTVSAVYYEVAPHVVFRCVDIFGGVTTTIVEENLHVQFIVVGNQSNGSTGTKACDNAGKAKMETIPGKDYILLPLSIQDLPFSSSLKDSPDAGFKPSGEEEKKDVEDPGNEDSEVLSTEEPRFNQEKDASVNSTNTINTVSPTINTAGIKDNV